MNDHFKELSCEIVAVAYNGQLPVLRDITLSIKPGERIALIGPNAAGKSTLLKAMAGEELPIVGRISLNGKALGTYPIKERARILTRVPQRVKIQAAFTVREYVAMGRYPHQKWGQSERGTDQAVIEKAMKQTGLIDLADRRVPELSGGEQQRVLLAQALAQETSVLLLDEPNTFLDIRHQFSLLDTLRHLNREQNLAIVLVLHDINLAAAFAERIILIRDGRAICDGDPEQVLTADNIESTYGVKATRIDAAGSRKPHFILWPLASKPHARNKGDRRLHIIGGGGSAGSVIQALAENGYTLTLGAIGQGDTDLQVASFYGVATTIAPAFSDLPEASVRETWEQIEKADGIVLANLCFGRGNLGNLQLVFDGLKAGKNVWVIEETPIESRDYTGGEAARIYRQLQTMGAVIVSHSAYLLDYLEERK